MPGPNYYSYYSGEPDPKKEEDKTWAIMTQYDIAHRRAHIELEGRKTRRMKDIDNYIAYINNEMPPSYRVTTVMHPVPYNLTYQEYEQIWLYTANESGKYEPAQPIRAMNEFVGDRIELQNDQAFVINSEFGYAVPAGEYVRMIDVETQDGYLNGYGKHRHFQSIIRELLGLPSDDTIGTNPEDEDGEEEYSQFDY